MSEELEAPPTRWETVRSIAKGLRPWLGDWHNFVDMCKSAHETLWRFGGLVLRLVLMLTFPLSILLLYPLVRAEQRKLATAQAQERERRDALIAKLTSITQKA
jgi:cytochrome c-type biogenesis protein CcmH/NrfG